MKEHFNEEIMQEIHYPYLNEHKIIIKISFDMSYLIQNIKTLMI